LPEDQRLVDHDLRLHDHHRLRDGQRYGDDRWLLEARRHYGRVGRLGVDMSPLDGFVEAASGLCLQPLCCDSLLRRRLRLWWVGVLRLRLSLLLLRGELGLDLL
jgi:hypothetical protein